MLYLRQADIGLVRELPAGRAEVLVCIGSADAVGRRRTQRHRRCFFAGAISIRNSTVVRASACEAVTAFMPRASAMRKHIVRKHMESHHADLHIVAQLD
jgi:hypothetical protein